MTSRKKNKAIIKLLVVLTGAWAFIGSGCVSALGLGKVKLKSKLHQPLNAEIELNDIKDLSSTEIFPSLASQNDFDRAGVQRPFSLTELQFKAVVRSDGTGVIQLSSAKPIQEPFLNFLLEVHWPSGRLLREYTLLMDPPVFDNQMAVSVQPPTKQSARSYPVPELQKKSPTHRPAPRPVAVDPSAPQYPDIRQGVGTSNGQSYQVKGNDSLWEIAGRLRPDNSVTVQQTMIALLRLNPDAFVGHNINQLRKGSVLRVPDTETAQALSHEQAVWQVTMQHRAWKQRKDLPPLDARRRDVIDARESVSPPVVRGQLSIVSPKATGRDDRSDSGTSNETNTALKNELMVTREQLDKITRENDELKSRLKELDEQINTLKKLMMLKDDQMAALQSAESTVSDAPEEVVEASLPLADNQLEQLGNETSHIAQTEDTQESQSQPEPDPVQQAEINQPIAAPESGFFGSTLFLIIMALIPMAAAAGFIYYRRLQSEDEFGDDDLLEALDIESDIESAQTSVTAGAEPELSIDDDLDLGDTPAADADSDPLSGADVHIAYGRFDDAIKLLENAIASEPDRADLKVKLLEVHAENSDAGSFRNVFSRLEQMGNADALKSAEVLKARFPDDTFAAGDGAEELSASLPETTSADADNLDAMSLDLNDAEDGFDPGALDDFDLNLNEPAPEPAVDPASAAQPQEDLSAGLDFDLGDSGGAVQEEVVQSPPAPAADAGGGNALEFDTSGLGLAETPATSEVSENAGSEVPGLEFDVGDLSLGDAGTQNISQDSSADLPDAGAAAGLDFQPEASSDDAGQADFSSDMDFDDLDGDMSFLSDDDEVATKLDLARAYIDMGDKDGASDILDEVVEQGSQEQQVEAKELLDQL